VSWFKVNCINLVYPKLVWKIPTQNKVIYLTFDDGPTPNVTPQVLALLHQYNAKATFFCLGAQAARHPDIINQIKTEGHEVANHGYSHVDGFFTSTNDYIKNAEEGAFITQSKLFRPPYGRITPLQYFKLKRKYKIVKWSIMSKDYNNKLTPEQCLKRTMKRISPGAIVVMHDSEKAAKNVIAMLPELLKILNKNNYQSESLTTLNF
jgi:peptidoglycan/xylan/chitin deacetylase (PgdA/CDA1 family)